MTDPVFRASLISLVRDLRRECGLENDHDFLGAILSDEQLLVIAGRLRLMKERPGLRFPADKVVR